MWANMLKDMRMHVHGGHGYGVKNVAGEKTVLVCGMQHRFLSRKLTGDIQI